MFNRRKQRPADLHFVLSPAQLTDFQKKMHDKTGIRFYRIVQYQKLFDAVLTTMRSMGYRIVKEEHLENARDKDSPFLG